MRRAGVGYVCAHGWAEGAKRYSNVPYFPVAERAQLFRKLSSIPTKLIYPLIAVNYLFQVSYFGANTRPAINVLPTRVLVAFGAFKLSIQEITARLDAPFVFYGGRREA